MNKAPNFGVPKDLLGPLFPKFFFWNSDYTRDFLPFGYNIETISPSGLEILGTWTLKFDELKK